MRRTPRPERGTIYTTSEAVYLVKPKNNKKFSLEELQKAVGGYIELLPSLSPAEVVYCNEDGLRLALPPNPHATSVVSLSRVLNVGFVAGNIISVYKIKEEHDEGRMFIEEVV